MSAVGQRLAGAWRGLWAGVPDRERLIVLAAMGASLVIALAYAVATRTQAIAGDEILYDEYGRFFAMGELWHATVPVGVEHASAWKPPLYPAWVGFWYSILGESAFRVALVQSFLAPLTVALSWQLGRRLVSPKVAVASACIVAVFPLVFEYYALLFPEALAIPLMVGTLAASIGVAPTRKRALGVGVLIGVALLLRPTSFFLIAAVAVAWSLAAGWRRGLGLTALAVGIAALVVAPWTIRNYVVTDGFIPISVQESGAYGTFNEESANDPDRPYAWRAFPSAYRELLTTLETTNDAEIRSELYDLAWDYLTEHPESVPLAFVHNGLMRFWEIRPPGQALDEVDFQGRSRAVRGAGLAMYYLLAPLALAGLWRLRSRRDLIVPLIALALAASLTYTIISGTRYRAPLEPVIVILAMTALLGVRRAPEQTPAGGASLASS